MATFNFRIKRPNTYGYRLLAIPRAYSITANGVSFNSVVGRIFNEDPTKTVGSLTVAWKKARTRHALFSGREETSGQVVTDSNGFFTITSITSSSIPGMWLMSFEALVEGRLIGDILFWNEVSDIIGGTENSNGMPDSAPVTDSDLADYAESNYEVYSYGENATPTTSKPQPWLPPPWYAISPEDQYNLDTDFNLAGYIGNRELDSRGILGRGIAVYSPRFIEPINNDVYDISGNGNNLSTTNSPEIFSFDGAAFLWFPGSASNHCTVTPPFVRSGDIILRATFELQDYTATSDQVLVDDHNGSNGVKITLLTSGILSIDLEGSTYQTTNPNLIDNSKYIIEIETNFLSNQLIVNIYDRNYYLIFRELIEIIETSVSSSGGDVYIGAQRDNTLHIAGKVYDFYYQDEAGMISEFGFGENFINGLSSATGEDNQGNTITLSRSSTGHKLALVDRPIFANKVDTYLTSDSVQLNPSTSSITLVVVLNYWNQPGSTEPIAMKKATVSTVADEGYALYINNSGSVYFRSSDGTTQNTRSIPSREGDGLHYVAIVGDRVADTIKLFDGVSEDSASWSVGSIDPTESFVLMNDSEFDNGFQGDLIGAALFKEALTQTEVEEVARKLGMSI